LKWALQQILEQGAREVCVLKGSTLRLEIVLERARKKAKTARAKSGK